MWMLLISLIVAVFTPDPPDAAYSLTLLPGPQVRVSLQVTGTSTGTTELRLQPHWGGIENDGGDVTALKVTDSKGSELTIEHPGTTQWEVTHQPSEPLTVSYIIPARELKPLLRGNDYRTRLEPGLFHMIGELGLILPEHFDNETARSVSVAFHGFDQDGGHVISSFGDGPGPFTLHRSGQDVRHTVILAGNVRTLTRKVKGNVVGIAIVGNEWGFKDDDFADLTTKIIATERDFWNDHTDPWFLVTLTPTGTSANAHSFSLGGTGLTDSFALFCNTGLTLDEASPRALQVKRLLAHEYFHTWNGGKIKSAGEEGAGYWFSEGFTDFYARRLLHNSGMYTDSVYLDQLNEMLGQAAGNPARNATASRVNDEFWKNQDVQKLPYQRGDQVALAVDEKIREVSKGTRSIDDLMKALLEKARSGEPFASEVVLKLIESETDAAFAASIRSAVVDGSEIPLPAAITAPRATLAKGKSRSFDAGFDIDASRQSKTLTGVRPGTAAHDAGLRNGQTLKGLSISSGTPEAPPFAKVTIEFEGAAKEITYDPLTPPIQVPRYTAKKSQ